ncbi:MAG: MlaD family protein [Candidatus Omnitrophica bacterium]|nr:MlaD family protein [Candidatus Omnitrophota bacterium]MCM8777240.1 MlaD family protein [Candidatus Omnitrophota bacterium]
MKRDKLSLEVRVGIFVIITILLAAVFIVTQATTGKYRGYEIGVIFDYVGGLESGSPVRVSGVRAGEVKKIEILYEAQPKVLARVKIRPDIKISTGSRITIQTLGLIGEKYIEITPSPEKKYIEPGEIVEGENPLSMEKLVEAGQNMIIGLNRILTDIDTITGDKAFRENVKSVFAEASSMVKKMETLTANLTDTTEKINKIVSDNATKIGQVVDNANEFMISSRETMDEFKKFAERGEKAAESFEDIKKAATSFEKMATDMDEFLWKIQNQGVLAKLMKEEEIVYQLKYQLQLLHNATGRFIEASERISEATINLNKIISDVEKGKGTAGKLLRDEELYNNLNDFVKDIKEHPWKLFIRRK